MNVSFLIKYIYIVCPPGYQRNGFVATHVLGHNMYIYIYIYIVDDLQMLIYGPQVYLIVLHTCYYWVDFPQQWYAGHCQMKLEDEIFRY